MRKVSLNRKTSETAIDLSLNLDGKGVAEIDTGIGFFDHMLDQLARHALFDLSLKVKGDLHIDQHHTIEDTGLALGQAFSEALGERRGITRWGEAHIPMDETLTRIALDLSNRPYLVWHVKFSQPKIGGMDSEMVKEWFHAFAQKGGITLHVENLYGVNNHHIVESCFKGLARALRMAVALDAGRKEHVPSTKGTLTR